MIITWVTQNYVQPSVVEYGISSLDNSTKGTEAIFKDRGNETRTIYMHRVKLTDLIPGQKYCKFELERRLEVGQ